MQWFFLGGLAARRLRRATVSTLEVEADGDIGPERVARRDTYGYGGRQTVAEAAIKSVVRSVSSQVGSQIGRALVRGVLGSLLK